MAHRLKALALALLLLLLLARPAQAADPAPAQVGERIRTELLEAQLALGKDPGAAARSVAEAREDYQRTLATTLAQSAPSAHRRIVAGLELAQGATAAGDGPRLADARAQVWTSLLDGGRQVVEQALRDGDGATARSWLSLREFRRATRFSRPDTDATVAVEELLAGRLPAPDAQPRVQADLYDTYQARLSEALHTLASVETATLPLRRAEAAGLADGYFTLLAPAYEAQRGTPALRTVEQLLGLLREQARSGQPVTEVLGQLDAALRGFRAAPLSLEEQIRRAGQLRRFLALVPVEYERGVRNGAVVRDFEIREAITFRNGAAAAFADLQSLLEARDAAASAELARLLADLEQRLAAAAGPGPVAAPDEISALTEQLLGLLSSAMPPEWQQHNPAADFDVIASLLDEMEAAAKAGQYDMAESARLEAYAVLESGPEARLIAFAPQQILPIEELFWYAQGDTPGLARLLDEGASAERIAASRRALSAQLAQAQQALSGDSSPTAVALNAATIVFREGLEAVLILASLMGSLRGESRRLRRPLWWGALASLGATVVTWFFARGLLASLARYGERVEAVVSLVAIGVLLLITNWFFHKVYWTGWLSSFHARKKRLVGGELGQILGLVTLGFTSIYREGFETVLFLQALVFEASTAVVLAGIAIGLAGTLLVGVIIFALQVKLPYKKMLIVTGVMIGAVLLIMVGHTVHVLQVVGWMPLHPIRTLQLPYWAGMWLGTFATWEGLILQIVAGAFVIGSYVLAERVQDRRQQPSAPSGQPNGVPSS